MRNRSTLFSALLRLVPLKLKWQRVFEHSRMIKYYRVLRRFRKKVFLLGKHGTLIFKKSMPFLFVATVSSIFYLLCLKLGSMDFFQSLLSKMGRSLGSRVLLSRGLGCEGGLLLVLILAAFGIFDETIMNMTGGNETVNQGPHRGDAGSYSTDNSEADSGSWRQYLNLSSDKEENAGPSNALPAPSPSGSFPPVPEALTPIPSVPSVPSLPPLEEENIVGRERRFNNRRGFLLIGQSINMRKLKKDWRDKRESLESSKVSVGLALQVVTRPLTYRTDLTLNGVIAI